MRGSECIEPRDLCIKQGVRQKIYYLYKTCLVILFLKDFIFISDDCQS